MVHVSLGNAWFATSIVWKAGPFYDINNTNTAKYSVGVFHSVMQAQLGKMKIHMNQRNDFFEFGCSTTELQVR